MLRILLLWLFWDLEKFSKFPSAIHQQIMLQVVAQAPPRPGDVPEACPAPVEDPVGRRVVEIPAVLAHPHPAVAPYEVVLEGVVAGGRED